ncbi:NAD(P)H-hydrate dehydratase [uncultured Leifsonia sp.]|uniref:ADP-dependent NAD(P)H-hydrate dehydratase n=1 Tax=uncultured Leifsonia sp. TaxID=340359 RepID=UPI0028D751B6|nr:NAD(P)H-hydrate dehydratase [uncultured Leifsonia sp.]
MSRTDRRVETVDGALLRGWPLPAPGDSKRSRGQLVVIGGARRSPGAALLAGRAALRVGAGRLTLGIGASAATASAVAFPESGVVPLAENRAGSVLARSLPGLAADVREADAVLLGPGLDDIGECAGMLRRLPRLLRRDAVLVLDAYALAAVAGRPRLLRGTRGILTPNPIEAEHLLGHPIDDPADAALRIARRYDAVVSCQGAVAGPDGRVLRIPDGGPVLGTSGSGDALAGAIAGLAARGCTPLQAATWGTYLHGAAGDTLAREIAPLGVLAGEIADRLAAELAAVEAG